MGKARFIPCLAGSAVKLDLAVGGTLALRLNVHLQNHGAVPGRGCAKHEVVLRARSAFHPRSGALGPSPPPIPEKDENSRAAAAEHSAATCARAERTYHIRSMVVVQGVGVGRDTGGIRLAGVHHVVQRSGRREVVVGARHC